MHSSAVCLLVLVVIATAAGYGVPPPPRCYSSALERHFNSGASWTEPRCEGATCVDGEIRTELCQTASIRLGVGCRLEDGAGGEFPDCCPVVVCPRPDQCYSAQLDQVFDDGAIWTEAPCTQFTCHSGTSQQLDCPAVESGAGCKVESGVAGQSYPACCDAAVCVDPQPTGYY